MRKYFLTFVALAVGLFATSCQESIVEPQVAGTTTFTVQIPDQMGTKADPTLGSAANVNQLFVAVYADASDTDATPIYRNVVAVSAGKATVSLNLIQGQLYDVIFWAQVGNNYVSAVQTDNEYTFDLVNIPMNKNYHNTDAGAAFFYYWDNFQPTGTSQPVTLRRPFAQLNLGTTEGSLTNNAGTFTLQSSVIKVKGIADNFNTVSGFGTVAEANKDIEYTFDAVALPSDEKINVAGVDYKYVSMDYLPIVGDDQALITVDATITLSNNQSINHKFTNVPVRENYRTNIVGNLISSTTDFNVVVDADFAKDEDGQLYPDNDILVVENAAAAQAALDNAKPGDVIELVAGVNYGTLLIRPIEGQSNTITDCDYLVYRNEMLRKVENLTIIGAPGATVDAIKVVAGYVENSGSTGYVVDIKNLVINSVEFTDKHTNAPHSYASPIFFDLSYINVNGLTVKNCKLIGNNDKMNFVYFYGSGKPANSTFETAAKNVIIENNTVDGIARLCELRQTENVTITENTIKNTALHGILLSVDNGTYSGNVTITENTAENIHERFVRMAGAGDAVVLIKDNSIINYQGADADYIKVTDGSNVTIENNVFCKFVYGLTLIPDGENSKIIVSDKEGFLNLTRLFADWTALFTDGNGNAYSNYANGAGVDYYYGGRWTVSLEADIDLNNETISPVILKHPVQAGAPTFDGNNHTIKNAKIVTDATTENEAGLFDASDNALKNLKLDNIHVTGSNVGNSTAGVLSGSVNKNVQYITITNSSVTGGKYTGGITGYGYTDVTNCSLTNVTVKGGYKLGGVIGYICASDVSGHDVTGNTLTDCTVDGIGGGVYAGGKNEYIMGKVVGNYNCNGTCKDNTITNMTTSANNNIGKIENGFTVVEQ